MAEAKLTAVPPGPAPRKPCLEWGLGEGGGVEPRSVCLTSMCDLRKGKSPPDATTLGRCRRGGKPGAQPA